MGCVHHNIKLQWGHHVLCRYGGRSEFLLQAGHCNHCWARRANWKCGLLIDWMEEGLMFLIDLYFAYVLIILICCFLLVIIFESLLLFLLLLVVLFLIPLLLLDVVAKVNIDIDVHWLSLYFNLWVCLFLVSIIQNIRDFPANIHHLFLAFLSLKHDFGWKRKLEMEVTSPRFHDMCSKATGGSFRGIKLAGWNFQGIRFREDIGKNHLLKKRAPWLFVVV